MKVYERLVSVCQAIVNDGQLDLCGHRAALRGALEALESDDGPTPRNVSDNMLGGFSDSTSRHAALDHYPRSGTLREKVLRAIVLRTDATSDELAASYGWRLYSVKPRMLELRRGGWIERTGAQRPSDTGSMVDVYRATEKGHAAVEEHGAVSA